MTPGLAAMIVGVFLVPVALLWAGHRLRQRSARWRAAFWGALVGHSLFAIAAMTAAMLPPEEWSAASTLRGLLGYWSLVLAPLIGAGIGAAAARRAAILPLPENQSSGSARPKDRRTTM